MEAEGGQGFPHECQRAALRGHGGREPATISTVEEPHSRRVSKLIHTETKTDREAL